MVKSKVLHWICQRYIPEFIVVLESINTRLNRIEQSNEEILKLLPQINSDVEEQLLSRKGNEMEETVKKSLALLVRHGLTALAGVMGWAWMTTGDLMDALVTVGATAIALVWSYMEKDGKAV